MTSSDNVSLSVIRTRQTRYLIKCQRWRHLHTVTATLLTDEWSAMREQWWALDITWTWRNRTLPHSHTRSDSMSAPVIDLTAQNLICIHGTVQGPPCRSGTVHDSVAIGLSVHSQRATQQRVGPGDNKNRSETSTSSSATSSGGGVTSSFWTATGTLKIGSTKIYARQKSRNSATAACRGQTDAAVDKLKRRWRV